MTGRYDGVEIAEIGMAVGDEVRVVRYLRRRRPPQEPSLPPLARHRVIEGDRPDLLAGRHLGEPTAWWRLADGRGVLDPDDLTSIPGEVVEIPTPEF